MGRNLKMAARHRHHSNPFTLRHPVAVPDWSQVFEHKAPFALDIGFGEGQFLLELAKRHPEWNIVGLEIRPHLVKEVTAAIHQSHLTNAHVVLANANLHLTELIPDNSVAFTAINFPDPWFKRRHQKRRVVNVAWLDLLKPKLQVGARIHAMSDFEPIANEIRRALETCTWLVGLQPRGTYLGKSSTEIMTEREVKHLARNEVIYRMAFEVQTGA